MELSTKAGFQRHPTPILRPRSEMCTVSFLSSSTIFVRFSTSKIVSIGAGSFGSPQGPVVQPLPGTVQPMRPSVEAPTSSRRSGESSRKRNQQQQQQQQVQQQQLVANVFTKKICFLQQHHQFPAQPYPMQMNPLNQMQQYMQQYQQYPTHGYGFDPAHYPQAAANTFWPGAYANQQYGKVNGTAMMPQVMYPNYPNGMNGMMHAAPNIRQMYPNSTGFNTNPNQFPPTFLPNYPNPPFYYK